MGGLGAAAGRLLKCESAGGTLKTLQIAVMFCAVPSVPTLPSVDGIRNSLTIPAPSCLFEMLVTIPCIFILAWFIGACSTTSVVLFFVDVTGR